MRQERILLLPLLICILLLQACKKDDPQPATPTNLLKNGDFESYPFQDWKTYVSKSSIANLNKYTVDYALDAASSPTHSIKVTCDAAKNDSTFQFLEWNFSPAQTPSMQAIPAGAKLTFKAKIKTVNMQGNGVSLAIYGATNTIKDGKVEEYYTSTEGKISITGTSDFKEYSITLDALPDKARSISVLLFYLPKTTGTVYYDDVSLTMN